MRKAWMMIGCPGSGKTWWAACNKEPGTEILSRDEIRVELGMCPEEEKCVGTREEEDRVTEIFDQRLNEVQGNVILDNTNANSYFRKEQIKKLHELGFHVIGVKMTTPLDVCLTRREGQIPRGVIEKIHKRTQKVSASEFDEYTEVLGIDTEDNEK